VRNEVRNSEPTFFWRINQSGAPWFSPGWKHVFPRNSRTETVEDFVDGFWNLMLYARLQFNFDFRDHTKSSTVSVRRITGKRASTRGESWPHQIGWSFKKGRPHCSDLISHRLDLYEMANIYLVEGWWNWGSKTDLGDGKALAALLELFTLNRSKLWTLRCASKDPNVHSCLRFTERRNRLIGIGAEDIIDGQERLILGKCWTKCLLNTRNLPFCLQT